MSQSSQQREADQEGGRKEEQTAARRLVGEVELGRKAAAMVGNSREAGF